MVSSSSKRGDRFTGLKGEATAVRGLRQKSAHLLARKRISAAQRPDRQPSPPWAKNRSVVLQRMIPLPRTLLLVLKTLSQGHHVVHTRLHRKVSRAATVRNGAPLGIRGKPACSQTSLVWPVISGLWHPGEPVFADRKPSDHAGPGLLLSVRGDSGVHPCFPT